MNRKHMMAGACLCLFIMLGVGIRVGMTFNYNNDTCEPDEILTGGCWYGRGRVWQIQPCNGLFPCPNTNGTYTYKYKVVTSPPDCDQNYTWTLIELGLIGDQTPFQYTVSTNPKNAFVQQADNDCPPRGDPDNWQLKVNLKDDCGKNPVTRYISVTTTTADTTCSGYIADRFPDGCEPGIDPSTGVLMHARTPGVDPGATPTTTSLSVGDALSVQYDQCDGSVTSVQLAGQATPPAAPGSVHICGCDNGEDPAVAGQCSCVKSGQSGNSEGCYITAKPVYYIDTTGNAYTREGP